MSDESKSQMKRQLISRYEERLKEKDAEIERLKLRVSVRDDDIERKNGIIAAMSKNLNTWIEENAKLKADKDSLIQANKEAVGIAKVFQDLLKEVEPEMMKLRAQLAVAVEALKNLVEYPDNWSRIDDAEKTLDQIGAMDGAEVVKVRGSTDTKMWHSLDIKTIPGETDAYLVVPKGEK